MIDGWMDAWMHACMHGYYTHTHTHTHTNIFNISTLIDVHSILFHIKKQQTKQKTTTKN